MIPSGYKEDKLYSVKPRNGDGDFTFTRASTGTRVNADGYIEEVPWNKAQYSQDFANAYWSKQCDINSDTQTSPIGSNDADEIVETTTQTYQYWYRQISLNVGVEQTYSVYVKYIDCQYFQLTAYNGGVYGSANFDLVNKTYNTAAHSSGLYEVVSANLEELENDWMRVSMTFKSLSSTSPYIALCMNNNSSAGYIPYYTGTSLKTAIWGFQWNSGSTKPYIKTTDRLDIPRLDYSGGATNPTLLLEPQRTNKSYNSEDWTVTGYIKNNVTVTANQTTSPDNTQTADQLDFGSGSGFFYENVTTITAASTYSVFVKYIDYQYIQIMGTGDVDHYANFDIQNGIVGNTGSESTASIEDYGNGWYRCIINYNSGTFAGGARVYKTTSLTAGWASGGGDAGSFYFWGNQMELGTFHTSYIPTSGTSVTRNLESGIITSATDLIGQTQGTLYSEFDLTEDNNFTIVEINLSNSTSNRILAYRNASYIQFIVQVGGVIEINNPTLVTFLDTNKIAVTYQTDDFKIYLNGSLVKTYTSGNIPSGFDTIDLQDNNLQGRKQGVKSLILFKEILTNDELEELTTI